jgi:hypothetical protein
VDLMEQVRIATNSASSSSLRSSNTAPPTRWL